MFKQKIEAPLHIPDEAIHLATDSAITNHLRGRGHTVKNGRMFITARHKETGATVSWSPAPGCDPQPIAYRAQILRALIRLGFFLAVIAIGAHFAGLL
jgi:hypothetical protein